MTVCIILVVILIPVHIVKLDCFYAHFITFTAYNHDTSFRFFQPWVEQTL